MSLPYPGDNETADTAQSAIGPDNTLPTTSCTVVHNTELNREEVILPSTAEQSTQSTESREILTTGEREEDIAEHDEEDDVDDDDTDVREESAELTCRRTP